MACVPHADAAFNADQFTVTDSDYREASLARDLGGYHMMGGSSSQGQGEPGPSSQPAATPRPSSAASKSSRKKRREEWPRRSGLGVPKYGCSMCHWVSSGCEECRPDYGMGSMITSTIPRAKRQKSKVSRQKKNAGPSATLQNGVVKQEFIPTSLGCSPSQSPTAANPAASVAPAALGTAPGLQFMDIPFGSVADNVTYTDSGRACKPPQAFVPGLTPSRNPNAAKKVKREQRPASPGAARLPYITLPVKNAIGGGVTRRPGTTLGMVGYPTVSLAGRAGLPARMIKVTRLDGSLGGPHLVDASLISVNMRRGRWPEGEAHLPESDLPARSPAEDHLAATTAASGEGTSTADAAAVAPMVHADVSGAHAAAAAPAVAAVEKHSNEVPRKMKKKRRRSTGSDDTGPPGEVLREFGVPVGTAPNILSEEATSGAACASAPPQEQRPAKRAKQTVKWLAARVLPGFDGVTNAQHEMAVANSLRTLLLVNAHCLDVDVTDAFATWHNAKLADVEWPLTELPSTLNPQLVAQRALQRATSFKALNRLPPVAATQSNSFLSSQLAARQQTAQQVLPLPRVAAKAVAAIPLLQLKAGVRAKREQLRTRKPIAPTRCMPGGEPLLKEFPLPLAVKLPREPWVKLPEPAHPAGKIQDLCASLRAGFVPQLRESDDVRGALESTAAATIAHDSAVGESDAAADRDGGSEPRREGTASKNAREERKPVAADGAGSSPDEPHDTLGGSGPLTVQGAEYEPQLRNSADRGLTSTGRNSCASDAADTSESSLGDPSDNDEAGPPPREKARSLPTAELRAPALPLVPSSGGIGSNPGEATKGSAGGSGAEHARSPGLKGLSVARTLPGALEAPSGAGLDLLPVGDAIRPVEQHSVCPSPTRDLTSAVKGAAGASTGASEGAGLGHQGAGQAAGHGRDPTGGEPMLEDTWMEPANLPEPGCETGLLGIPEWTPHRPSAMEAAGDVGPTAAFEAISNLFELESPGYGPAGSPVGTPASRSSKSADFGATAMHAGNQQNTNPALVAVLPGSRTPRKVAFSEHVQAHEFREEQPRRDTPYKAPTSQPLPRSQQYASLSSSLGSASRLLNWPGSRVQALAAADARALDVAKVLEIPRQLKYARKTKHCSPSTAFAIQALPVWSLEEQTFREAYLNAKLAQKWLEPEAHPWAALDFAGVQFAEDACSKHILRYGKIAAELVHNKGKAAVEELQVTVEREWLQLKTIRRRFNGGSSPVLGDKQDKDSPVMSGPPKIRSILKRRSSVRPPSPLPAVSLSGGCLAGHVALPLARTLLTDDAAVAAITM